MKTNLKNIALALLASFAITSCSTDSSSDGNHIPSAPEFNNLRQAAMENITQHFTITAGGGSQTFTTDKGVQVTINGNCLTLNGNPVATGQIDIEYAEIFDRGTMLVTDKTTMGRLPNGDMALLISGGEFFIDGTLNGQQLAITCPIQLQIPANLTGGVDNDMTLWNGNFDEDGNLEWDEVERNPNGQNGGVFGEGGLNGAYYAFLDQFGWSNVDRFYSDPRPKTTILAEAPAGYNYENSAIYLHYDGQGSGLAKLDTFDPVTNRFSEHYGQVPIGLEAHVIFVTEDGGNYRYAIKSVTVAAGDVYVFTTAETILATEAQVIAAINGLP